MPFNHSTCVSCAYAFSEHTPGIAQGNHKQMHELVAAVNRDRLDPKVDLQLLPRLRRVTLRGEP